MSSNIESEIRARVDTFVTDLCAIIRIAALEAVRDALGVELGSGPVRREKEPVKVIKPAPAKAAAKTGRRVRRSSEDLEKVSEALTTYLSNNPGQRLEQIGAAMGVDTKDLKRPVQVLLEAGTIRTEGQRRGTKYFLAEAAVAPKAKTRKAKVKTKGTTDAAEEEAEAA